jgi:LPS export ABC transporter protein LptC
MKMTKEKHFYLYGFKEFIININTFLAFIFFGLTAIFFMFKPLEIEQQKHGDIPLLSLKDFVMYELNTQGLETYMLGTEAIRFKDRYEVIDIDYTDNAKEYIAHIKANFGRYKTSIVDLNGDVRYTREDGIVFESQHVVYNKLTTIAISDNDYVIHKGNNRIIGSYLKQNNLKNTIYSQNIRAIYQLQEGKQ